MTLRRSPNIIVPRSPVFGSGLVLNRNRAPVAAGGLTNLLGFPLAFHLAGSPAITRLTSLSASTLDDNTDAVILIGHIETSDGGSHTIDTSGSSKLNFLTGSMTYGAGTTIRIGLAELHASAGPPGRADHSGDVINFDCYAELSDGAGLTASAWNTITPTNGSKTLANGDLVCFAVQMVTRGGTDSVQVRATTQVNYNSPGFPCVTKLNSGTYSADATVADFTITFSDGATAIFLGAQDYTGAYFTDATNAGTEKGNRFQFPFPCRITGGIAAIHSVADFALRLYGDPFGTPVLRANTITIPKEYSDGALLETVILPFVTPYEAAANEELALVVYNADSVSNMNTQATSSAAWRGMIGGTTSYKASRNGTSGSMTASAFIRMWVSPLIEALWA